MATVQQQSFGALLRRYRLAAGLTLEGLAERARLSARGLSDLERGINRAPRKETLLALVETLQLAEPERAVFERAARRWSVNAPASSSESASSSSGQSFPSLIGRDKELRRLARHLAGEGPAMLLLAGEPGIGKTRLLQEATRRASETGWQIFCGGCHRCSGQEPFAPLLEALAGYLRSLQSRQMRTALDGCAWLARLLPELTENATVPAPRWTLPPEQERRLMFVAVRRFLANVAGPAGTLLVLDDLQWAETDALDLLAALLRSPASAPLRVVGAYRSTDVHSQHALAGALSELAHDGLATYMPLGPLVPQHVRVLLNHLLQDVEGDQAAFVERLQARAGGVPFFLVSCAQALRAGALDDQAVPDIPWDVAQSIHQRVAALSEPAQEVLQAAAIAGRQVEREVLYALAARLGQSAGDGLAALESLCQARLLEEAGADAYTFVHDLIREALLADISAARRALLHEQVAWALEQQPGEVPLEALAYHYSQAGKLAQAIIYLERAGEHAQALHAHAEAAASYQKLAERLDALGRGLESARAREKLGKVLCSAARYERALRVLETAATSYQAAGALEEMRQTLAQIGRVHAQRGTPEAGLTRLEPALEAAGRHAPSAGLASLQEAVAMLYYFAGRYPEQLALATEAVRQAQTVGDNSLLLQAQHVHSLALFMVGRSDEALQAAEEVIALAEKAGDLATLARALNNAGHAYDQRGDYARGTRYLRRALEAAEHLEDQALVAYIASNLGDFALLAGSWGEARQVYERAASIVRKTRGSWASPAPLIGLGDLCLAQGQWEASERYFEEAAALAARDQPEQLLVRAQLLPAERDLLEGRPASARARLEPFLDNLSHQAPGMLGFLPSLAWALLELGEEGQAEILLEQFATRARAQHRMLALADTLRVKALLEIRQGQWPKAREFLDEALRLTRMLSAPYAEAKTLYACGLLHIHQGNQQQARECLEASRSILNRLDEQLYLTAVEQALTTLEAGQPRELVLARRFTSPG